MRHCYSYPATLAKQEDGGFLVTFPDVPESLTEGESFDEAIVEARDALTAALAGYMRARRDIPVPPPARAGQTMIHLSPLVAAKLALYEGMRRQGVSNVELACRLGIAENAVRRLIDPGHRSHIGQVEKALNTLHVQLVVEALAA